MEKLLYETLPQGKFIQVEPQRSKVMRAVKSTGNKSTEVKFCGALAQAGLTGWQLQANLAGRPDIYFPAYRLAVFLDGCFWHGCPQCGHIPKMNRAYWQAKIMRNQVRDREKTKALANAGYTVVRFWEHELKANLLACAAHVAEKMENSLLQLQDQAWQE